MHRRAKLTVLGRRLLVQRILTEGWPVARAAEAQGVSVATAYKWLGRWRAEGEAGLADRSCRPHRSPRRLPAEREQAILAWRQRHRVGPHRIGWALGEAPSTVHAVLSRHRLARLWELDRPSGQVVRYQRERPGELVHVDIKLQGRIPDGGGHRLLGRGQGGANRDRRHGLGYDYLHVAVDDRTRLAYVEAHDRQDGLAAAAFTTRALAWFDQLGIRVERVLTDNGWCYRSQAFQQVLRTAGAQHRRTRPYRPQTNGKAERFNLTLATEWSDARLYTSNQARLDALGDWLHHYNCPGPTLPWTEGAQCNSSTTSLETTASRHGPEPSPGPRALADAGLGELRRQLTYKTTWYGSRLIVADRFYPSSKSCSACGWVKAKLTLAERTFACEARELRLDRDLNAARNLVKLAEHLAQGGWETQNARGADRKTQPAGRVAMQRESSSQDVQ